jgi:hypothetical protein
MTDKDSANVCHICGAKSFSWGYLAGALYRGERPYRWGFLGRLAGLAGDYLTVRLCNNCGNAQLFDSKVLETNGYIEKEKRKNDSV